MFQRNSYKSFDRQLRAHENNRGLAPGRVALISSIFDADEYLEQFLSNIAALDSYDACEHFLIRAGSPGNEHEALMEHVKQHPNAVYINLERDPGLYEVWNLAVRLATAPYLSTANVDDRRAPEHLATLMAYLDNDQSIDVASTALRVTETSNLAWEDSEGCPVWYGESVGRHYEGKDLLKPVDDGFTSHNIPHCMPVWRRELHALHGYFNEKEFGPSADWEFWLRVGQGGHRFYLHGEPLGLYLKRPDSYWKVANRGQNFDGRIIAKYQQGNWGAHARPASLDFVELASLYHCGAFFDLVGRIFAFALQAVGQSRRYCQVLDETAKHYLGVSGVTHWLPVSRWPGDGRTRTSNDITDFIVDCLHREEWIGRASTSLDVPARVLETALIDLECMRDRQLAILTRALLNRRLHNNDDEVTLLRQAHAMGADGFWRKVQRVYRFDCPLIEILKAVDDRVRPEPQLTESPDKINLFYYPDFTAGNLYQHELYKGLKKAGARIEPIQNLVELSGLEAKIGKTNVVHLHWINALFKGLKPSTFDRQAKIFKTILEKLKGKGFDIYWTVHNTLNHETIDAEQEWQFRRDLASMVDRVYIHHPMAVDALDWLPTEAQPYLCEHGNVPVPELETTSRAEARKSFGVGENDFLMVYTGRIRDYKGLDEYLPLLAELLSSHSTLHIRIMGRIASRNVKHVLNGLNEPRLKVEDRVIAKEEMDRLFLAADAGLLTYKDILTSGLLFHMFSAGLPVLAPDKGTIPGYVINGWNGFLYESQSELKTAVEALHSCPRERLARMRTNALKTARQLDWALMSE